MNGDRKIAGRHEFIDDAVDGGKELLQILSGAGFFRGTVESRVESFGALAIGNVAVDEVKASAAPVDQQGSGGNGNIEQSSIAVTALSFEANLFAALQALRDPVKFGSTLGRKNQRVDALRQDLIGGVAEQALKFAIHTLRAERSVDHKKSVG